MSQLTAKPLLAHLTDLRNILASPKKILITCHRKPDGDAIGASMGLYHFLKDLGHEAHIVTPTDYPKFLQFLPDNNLVVDFIANRNKATKIATSADVLFFLDFNDLKRTEGLAPALEKATGTKILIDHHLHPKPIAHYQYSDTSASSTAQMVYEFIDKLSLTERITPTIATSLYLGLISDTGRFKHAFGQRELEIAAKLVGYGADALQVNEQLYDSFTEDRLRLLGYSITEGLHILPEYNTAYISLPGSVLQGFNYQNGDTEGIVNYALSISGIKMAILVIEREDKVKLSLRSKGNFSVSDLANKHFNGGGHKNAAGGISNYNLTDTLAYIERILPDYKAALNE